MLFACVGVAFGVVLGTFVSTTLGAVAFSITMVGAGIWRAWAPKATRAAGIAVRSKWFDVVFYVVLGVAIAALALTYPEALGY
jgi:ABC-type lipoprotein release transport system permease subunit